MKPGDDMIMVGNAYGPSVARWLADHAGPRQPHSALAVYTSLLCHIAPGSGELRVTAVDLAREAMVDLSEIEPVMLELARLRVVVRDPRQSGDAWFINPHLAWAGSLEARARFAALVPPPDVRPRGS